MSRSCLCRYICLFDFLYIVNALCACAWFHVAIKNKERIPRNTITDTNSHCRALFSKLILHIILSLDVICIAHNPHVLILFFSYIRITTKSPTLRYFSFLSLSKLILLIGIQVTSEIAS